MVRVTGGDVIIVQPFECAWLTGNCFELHKGSGCISFDVQDEHDVTVIFQTGPSGSRHVPSSDRHRYTVVLGSHRNRKFKIERDGDICVEVDGWEAKVGRGKFFRRYWVQLWCGRISVGLGKPVENVLYQWADPRPLPDMSHVGLSTWDTHIAYKNVLVERVGKLKQRIASWDDLEKLNCSVLTLRSLCSKAVIEQLECDSACDLLHLTNQVSPSLAELHTAAVMYLAERFDQLMEQCHPLLMMLPATALQDLLRSPCLVTEEVVLLKVVEEWLECSAGARASTEEVEGVLGSVRFGLLSAEALEVLLSSPMARSHEQVPRLVAEAQQYRQRNQSQPDATLGSSLAVESGCMITRSDRCHGCAADAQAAVQCQPRVSPQMRELLFVCAGDSNGACHFIGSSYGTQPWVNPVVTRQVKVTASSPSCRHMVPKHLTSGQFHRVSFSGPEKRSSDSGDMPRSWWALDLGIRHILVCNYYTLRQDGSSAFPRSWVLQGSWDRVSWATLREHTNDRSISRPGQYGAWAVTSPAASMPFRSFRVMLTGPTANADAPWNLSICTLELYGFFNF